MLPVNQIGGNSLIMPYLLNELSYMQIDIAYMAEKLSVALWTFVIRLAQTSLGLKYFYKQTVDKRLLPFKLPMVIKSCFPMQMKADVSESAVSHGLGGGKNRKTRSVCFVCSGSSRKTVE